MFLALPLAIPRAKQAYICDRPHRLLRCFPIRSFSATSLSPVHLRSHGQACLGRGRYRPEIFETTPLLSPAKSDPNLDPVLYLLHRGLTVVAADDEAAVVE